MTDTMRVQADINDRAMQQYYGSVGLLMKAAMDCDCRLAVTLPLIVPNLAAETFDLQFIHVMLSDGESPPADGRQWEIYENRGGMMSSRSYTRE